MTAGQLPGVAPPWVLILANPGSGWRRNENHVRELVLSLERRRMPVTVEWRPVEEVPCFGDAAALASCRAVVVAGGDGTVNRVINCRPTPPLAIFPLGTENLFAKALGFGRDPETLAERIVTNHVRSLDLGRAGDQGFSLVASAGFDGDVAHRFDDWRRRGGKLRRGKLLYYCLPVLRSFCRYAYPRITVETNDTRTTGTLVMVFNLPIYARKLQILPEARPDDGLLDWIVLERGGSFSLLRFVFDVIRGKHLARSDVRWGRAEEIRVSSETSVPVQCDGEATGTTPLTIRVDPATLRIVTAC